MFNKEKKVKENNDEKRIKIKKSLKNFKIWGKWYTPVIISIVLIGIFVGAMYGIELLKLPTVDITTNGKYTLTDITKDYLKDSLEKNITMYIMYQENDNVKPPQVDGMESFLRNYETYSNGKVKVELVNTSQNKEIAEKYGVDLSTTNGSTFSVVYESGEEFKKVDEYGFYMRELYEEVSTNAILEITSQSKENVYFVEGYSSNMSLDNAFSTLSTIIQKEVFNLDKLQIKLIEKIPEDAKVLILCGLQKDLEEQDLNKLIEYFENGGKIMVLQQYVGKNFPNLQKLVGTVGIKFESNIIYEGSMTNRLSMSACTIIPEFVDGTLKSAMDKRQENVIFDGASTLTLLSQEEMKNRNVITTELLATSDKAWVTTNFNSYLNTKPSDAVTGKQIIGAMGEKAPAGNHDGRIVVYTNDYFIRDDFINQYQQYGSISNIDYVIENLIMLTGRTDVVNIDKNRQYPVYKMYTSNTKVIIEVISYSIPALVLIVGLVIWIYRKNRK